MRTISRQGLLAVLTSASVLALAGTAFAGGHGGGGMGGGMHGGSYGGMSHGGMSHAGGMYGGMGHGGYMGHTGWSGGMGHAGGMYGGIRPRRICRDGSRRLRRWPVAHGDRPWRAWRPRLSHRRCPLRPRAAVRYRERRRLRRWRRLFWWRGRVRLRQRRLCPAGRRLFLGLFDGLRATGRFRRRRRLRCKPRLHHRSAGELRRARLHLCRAGGDAELRRCRTPSIGRSHAPTRCRCRAIARRSVRITCP